MGVPTGTIHTFALKSTEGPFHMFKLGSILKELLK